MLYGTGDFEAVKTIAEMVGPLMDGREATGQPMTICGLSRANEKDIRACYDAVKAAPRKRIHTFIGKWNLYLYLAACWFNARSMLQPRAISIWSTSCLSRATSVSKRPRKPSLWQQAWVRDYDFTRSHGLRISRSRRSRILYRRRVQERSRLPLPGACRGNPCRRAHAKHSRHCWLHDAC